jgi:hypothetical protein
MGLSSAQTANGEQRMQSEKHKNVSNAKVKGLPTKEFIGKASLLKNLPLPLFAKEGYITSLWQREVRRDFIINVFILMTLLVTGLPSYQITSIRYL